VSDTPRALAALSTLRRNAPAAALGIGIAVALHVLFGNVNQPYAQKLALDIGIAIVLAVSLTMVNGFTGQFSMGHAGFMAMGGYAAAAITHYGSIRIYGDAQARGGVLSWGLDLGLFDGPFMASGELLFLFACVVGGLVAAAAGYVVGMPSLRLRGDYLAIVTLGFGEIVRVMLQGSQAQIFGSDAVRDASPLKLAISLGEAVGFNFIPIYTTLFWAWLWVAITVLVTLRLKNSSYGRAFLAIREDEIAAEAMGVHTTRYKVRAFVLSSFFAGVAGALFAHQNGSINAGELGFIKSFDIIIIVVLGGLGSVSGAILAAIVLTILPEALRDAAQYRMIVYALLLILVMILRPKGLLGIHELWEIGWFRTLRRSLRAGSGGGGRGS